MKKTRILFAIGFVLAIGSAFTLNAKKPLTTRYTINSLSECVSIETADCDGPSTNPVCSNIFVTNSPSCSGTTYQTNP